MIQKPTDTGDVLNAESLHRICQEWLSAIHFAKDELRFIERLLFANVYEPDTPNLFERIQDYSGRLEEAKAQLEDADKKVHDYERDLSSIIECDMPPKDLDFDRKHPQLEREVQGVLGKFGMLKSEIFNYTGGILKTRKD